jgi:hypothetical protein
MPISSLRELREAICEVAGFAPLSCPADDEPPFAIRLGGVMATMMDARPGAVLFILQLGVLPASAARAGWLVLLDANAVMMDMDAPRFARHPPTGEVVLCRTCPLDSLSATDAYEIVMRMVALACAWRENHLLDGSGIGAVCWSPPVRPSYSTANAMVLETVARFHALHRDLCAMLGPCPMVNVAEGGDCFEIRCEAIRHPVTVVHAASTRPGIAFVTIRLGTLAEDDSLERSTALMDTNFALMNDPAAMTFCRDPSNGEFLLMYAHRLGVARSQAFLEALTGIAAVACACVEQAAS